MKSVHGLFFVAVSAGGVDGCDWSESPDAAFNPYSVQCFEAGCDSPKYYVLADGNGHMNVITFNSYEDALNDVGGYNWWKSYVTRQLYDAERNYVLLAHAGSCDIEDSDWKTKSKDIAECKYPDGEWQYVWGISNPLATHTHTMSTTNGYTRGQENSMTEKAEIDIGAKGKVFSATEKFSFAATQTSSQTWNQAKTVSDTIEVKAGHSVYVWQYVLTCQGYTYWGLFTEKLTFSTSQFTDTKTNKAPTCLPQDCDQQGLSVYPSLEDLAAAKSNKSKQDEIVLVLGLVGAVMVSAMAVNRYRRGDAPQLRQSLLDGACSDPL